MDEQTLSLIPATEEDLQYLNSAPQSPSLVPATEDDLQYITPEIREPTMQEMTSDFETFKMFRKAGAFDSGKTATEMVTEGVSGMASDLGHWAMTLPVRLAQNFADDKYAFNRKAKAEAKATTLQTLGNLELDYKSIGAGISRGVDKVFGDAETEEDLRSSYEFFKTQADLEQQRQGKAAEMVTEGFLGMSPEFLTLGMPEEQREMIRSQQVMPDMKAARGGTLPADPLNFVPLGAAVNVAKGTGRATLKGAEKVLINETLQLAKLQDNMTKALSRVGDNAVKSRRLAIKQAPVQARLEKGLAEVTKKITENQAKLKPLAAKRDMALTKLASDLPVGNPLKDFLNDALKEVPIKQPLNLTNKVGGAGLVAVGKPIEYLGNALQFIKTLPQETAINMLMKAGDKVGMEVTEQQANALIKSGVIGGVGYGGYSFTGEFTDSELAKLGGAVGALLGPQFLARFGRNTAILGREAMKPASDLPFFTRLASKDAEKMTTQLIDRTALVPVESVARQVTGAAEGKVLSRMAGPQAFGRMSPGGQATVNFLDRTGLGRYVESTGRMAKGVGAGGAVGGAFGLAASGGMDMPEAFYGGIGAGMLFGSAGAVGGEVARFTSPINHMEARYGDLYHYAENYLPAGQKESFNKLNRDVQMAVANKIVANPSLAIEYVSNGKDGEGGYFDRVTGDIVINVDSPRAIEPLLAHEFTHYLEQTGGKRKFIDLLIGNPMTGKPGIFVQRVTKQNKSKYPDLKVGDPIMVGEGANRKFLLSDEFETARSDYGKKLQDTLLDSDGNKMSDSDLAKIMTDEQTVSEIVAEHGTDFLLNDKRKYRDRNRGTIGKIMGGMLDTELVQNIPLLRKTLSMMGGTFRPDGQLVTDNKLFSNLKRYPQITELVRKYNNQLEGMSPQKREALEASGQIQGGNIKSGEKATKEVVVDIKSAELAKSPQLAELLRSGTLLQIDKDGNVIPNLAMTSREQGKYNRSFAEKMKEAIEEKEANEGLPEGHVRPEVNEKTGKIRFVGRYLDDSVIDKLEQSGNWNKEQIQTLRDVNFNIRNKGGNEYLISYFKAAGQGGGKYVNAKVENHIEVPYGFEITQKNNIILRTVSVNQLVKNVDQLARQQQAELTRLYGADIAQAKIKLLQDLDRYHRNHADGQPGRTGLDADQNIAKAKADFINSAFGSGTKAEASSNPWRQSLGKKNPRDVYRSRRIERIGKMDQLSGTRFIDYDKINKAFIPAYHGTPHTLAPEAGAPLGKFRTSKIGTGEGAQAYGHGLYFAGNKEVAAYYREQLAPAITKNFKLGTMDIFKNEVPLDYSSNRLRRVYGDESIPRASLIETLMIDEGTIRRAFLTDGEEGAKKAVKEVIEDFIDTYDGEADYINVGKKALKMPIKFEVSEPGSLYKVELAPKENEYLLWDKPLSEQPKAVREKLAKTRKIEKRVLGAGVNKKEVILNVDDKFTKGGDAYKELATELTREKGQQDIRKTGGSAMGEQDALASQFLKEAGIPGIKYLDGSSRSKGEGDYNYVIFDEADVTVTEKLFMPMSKEETIFAEVMSDSKFKSDSKRRAEMVKRGVPQDRDFLELGQEVRKKLGIAPHESIKDAYKAQSQDKLFMPASEAGATKGKQAEAAKLWQEKGVLSKYFKKWFGKSKVVDEKGEPLVVYHGTDRDFNSFDTKQIGSQFDGYDKIGFFFTTDKFQAEGFAHGFMAAEGFEPKNPKGRVLETYLNIEKPLTGDIIEKITKDPVEKDIYGGFYYEKHKAEIEKLMSSGKYDGLIIGDLFVATKPEQIKSATGNRGTFDAGERNILFMPASEAKNPKSGDMLTLDDKSLKLFLPSPSNPNASLSEFKGKNVQVLTADLSVVGNKKADGVDVAFTGGPGYLSVNDAWGFTNEASAKGFKTRWENADRPLIGITSMKQDNHKASSLTREYYVRKFMQAINEGKISENTVNRHIRAALKRAIKGKGLTDNQKAALKTVKTIQDFLRVFPDKELIPWKATPIIYDKLNIKKELPITQARLKKLGLDTDTILRETRQPEYNDIQKGSLLAIAEYDGSDAVYRPDLNSAYPWSIPLKEKAFLKEFADIQDLSSRQDLRGSDGEANIGVAMGAGVMLDKLGRGDVNFMPADPKAPKRQPANRIQQQAPAMPGNRFMAPAASAGAKSAERFR
jgi:hypothetical protein